MTDTRPPDWENTVLALRNVLVQLDGWAVECLLDRARVMAAERAKRSAGSDRLVDDLSGSRSR